MTDAGRKYLAAVSAALPPCGEVREVTLAQLEQSVTELVETKPDTEVSQLEERFGTPREILLSCIPPDWTPPSTAPSPRQRFIQWIVTVLAVLLGMAILIGSIAYVETHKPPRLRITTTITEEPIYLYPTEAENQ